VAASVELWNWWRSGMITNDEELDTTLDRIRQFQAWIRQIRQVETNPTNYRSSVSGFLAELDRMQLEVRQYLSETPAQAEHGRVG
jgi:hypothetical protein